MKLIVDPPEVHKASQKFSELSVDYTDVYKSLMNTASTMGEAWKAADNLAFVDQIRGFCDDLEYMVGRLLQASETLKQQAANYEATRDNNISNVKKLAN
jgi:WXG100 family type VII secretion target